jgi:hypothetical protein
VGLNVLGAGHIMGTMGISLTLRNQKSCSRIQQILRARTFLESQLIPSSSDRAKPCYLKTNVENLIQRSERGIELNNSRLTRFTLHALGVLEEKIMTYSWYPRVVSKNIPHESVTVERKELIPRFTVRKFEHTPVNNASKFLINIEFKVSDARKYENTSVY